MSILQFAVAVGISNIKFIMVVLLVAVLIMLQHIMFLVLVCNAFAHASALIKMFHML
jgi:hypothetical protein